MKYFNLKSSLNILTIVLLIMGCAACKTSSEDMPDRGICAHRGAMDTHPENTLAAFREAVRLGAHMIEFDVRMTKDAHLVILHDETVDRTTNEKGKISELTIDEVKHLDAGSWKSEEFADERIPTLKEALAVMPENIWLNVHIKGGKKLGKKVARVIMDENRVRQAFLACGSDAADGAKEINRDIMICNMERQGDRNEYINETIRQRSQFIQLLGKRTNQTAETEIAILKQHDIRINYCCTDSSDEVKTLFKSGVDFILTNKLSEMLETAESMGIKPLHYRFKNSNATYEQFKDGIIVHTDQGFVKLQVCAENIIRVVVSPIDNLNEKESLMLIKYPGQKVKWDVSEEGDEIALITERVIAKINIQNYHVSFFDTSGRLILDGAGHSLEPAEVSGESVYHIR